MDAEVEVRGGELAGVEAGLGGEGVADLGGEVGDAFAAKTGFDPRELTPAYLYFRIHPRRLQAWREANELKDRELLHDGEWVA